MEKYELSFAELEKIEQELTSMKLLDILFHYPDGPRYDIALYLMATTP